jgi:ComF family protein
MKLKSKTRHPLLHGFLDLFFPRNDLFFNQALEYEPERGLYLGSASRRYLRLISEPFCATCGFPLFGKVEKPGECQKCSHLKANFEANRSVILLNRLGKRIVHELKYHQGQYLLSDIKKIMAESQHIEAWIKGSILVPIPLHNRKYRERGYNQSEMLAQAFASVWGDSHTERCNLLCRQIDTDTQTRMDRSARMKNVKGAFALNPSVNRLTDQRPVTLIDDVFTTGSTINECARILRKSGYSKIRSLTFGHG